MQKRLMILGTLFELTDLVKKAKVRGYYTVVCDGNADGPARAYADKDYVADVRDVEKIARICREENIDAIITSFSDLMFEMMVRIADRAGIPCYGNVEMLPAYRDKQVTKAICRKLGFHVPEFRRISEEEYRTDKAADDEEGWHLFPAIIKPVDSYGSRGLRVVWNREEIQNWFRETDPGLIHGKALLESVSQGQELNVQAAVSGGKVHLISVADRMTAELDRSTIRVNYANIYPSRYFDQAAPLVLDILQKYADETGQKQGPMAMQCFWNGRDIEIGEIAARFFGFEHELTAYTTGLSLEDYLLDLACEPDQGAGLLQNHDARGEGCAAGIYLTTVRPGVLADQSAVRAQIKEKHVVGSHFFYKEGDAVGRFGPAPYFARYYVRTETRKEMDAVIQNIMRHVHAEGKEGGELLFLPRFSDR